MKVNTVPSTCIAKKQLIDWLSSHGVLVSETVLKAELVHLVAELKVTLPGLKKYRWTQLLNVKDMFYAWHHTTVSLTP